MNRKKTIIYLISHGHTARGVLQTALLRKFIESEVGVVVVAKENSEGLLRESVEKQGALIDFYSAQMGKWDAQRTIFRSYVHQDIKKNPALWEKHQRRVSSEEASIRRKLINYVYFFIGNLVRLVKPLRVLYRWVEGRVYFSAKAIDILRKYNPDAIISTRPVDSMEAEFLNAATRLKVHKIMYILSWDNITSKGIFPELADSYLTWGEIMNQELREYYGVKDSQLYLTGVTHFDVHASVKSQYFNKNSWVENLGLTPKQPYMLFTMSASYFAPFEIDVIEWLADKVQQDLFGSNMQLIVRPHMQNIEASFSDESWIQRLNNLISSRVAVDWPDVNSEQLAWFMSQQEMIKLSRLLKDAVICLNSGSTISIEACIFDRPTILTMIDIGDVPAWKSVTRILKFKHIERFLSFGAVEVVGTFDELYDAIVRGLSSPSSKSANRMRAVEMECYRVDQKSTDRFVQNVLDILGN